MVDSSEDNQSCENEENETDEGVNHASGELFKKKHEPDCQGKGEEEHSHNNSTLGREGICQATDVGALGFCVVIVDDLVKL